MCSPLFQLGILWFIVPFFSIVYLHALLRKWTKNGYIVGKNVSKVDRHILEME